MQTTKSSDVITERRIKPIYDYLDSGNNKKALQEAEKVLKKQKDSAIVQLLKALSLIRLGNIKDSKKILDEVIDQHPTDIHSLKVLRFCLHELNLNDKIFSVYENAVKKNPNDEELLTQLFIAYAIEGDFKKQSTIAINLNKNFPKIQYKFWSIMSYYMQAINHPNEEIAKKTLLPLAKKIFEKIEDKIQNKSEVELYLLVLDKLEDFDKGFEVLNGNLGKLLDNSIGFVDQKKATCFFKLNKYESAFDIYSNLIKKNNDQVDFYLNLIELYDKVLDKKPMKEKILKLFEELKDCGSRGYHLAKIEYTFQNICHFDTIQNLLLEYYKIFGKKQVFIYDMYYLDKKYKLPYSELTNSIKKDYSFESLDNENSLNYHHINYQALNAISSPILKNKEEKVEIFEKLISFYEKTSKKLFTKTEINPSDFYLQILVHHLDKINFKEEDDLIFCLILTLENALRKCSANYTFKIYLIHLYNLIGSVGSSHFEFEKLDIKYVLYDSLGYLIFNELFFLNHFSAFAKFISILDKFFTANSKEAHDHLSLPCKYNNYLNIIEILEIEKRFRFSIQNFEVQMEKIFLDIIIHTKSFDQIYSWINTINISLLNKKLEQELFIDNRDFSVYRAFDNKIGSKIIEKQEKSFTRKLKFLKLRFDLINLIVEIESFISKRENERNFETEFSNKLNLLENSLKINLDLISIDSKNTTDSLSGHFNCKTRIFLEQTNNLKSVITLIKIIYGFLTKSEKNDDTDFNEILEFIDSKIQIFEQFDVKKASFSDVTSYLNYLNSFVELISIKTFLFTLLYSFLSKSKNQSKEFKTNTSRVNQSVKKIEFAINDFISFLKSLNFNEFFKAKPYCKLEETICSKETEVTSNLSKRIKQNIQNSYTQSIKETIDILINKTKHLSFLQKTKI